MYANLLGIIDEFSRLVANMLEWQSNLSKQYTNKITQIYETLKKLFGQISKPCVDKLSVLPMTNRCLRNQSMVFCSNIWPNKSQNVRLQSLDLSHLAIISNTHIVHDPGGWRSERTREFYNLPREWTTMFARKSFARCYGVYIARNSSRFKQRMVGRQGFLRHSRCLAD